jgi:hypothetical protein
VITKGQSWARIVYATLKGRTSTAMVTLVSNQIAHAAGLRPADSRTRLSPQS